jgi:uncharacterized membrane protein
MDIEIGAEAKDKRLNNLVAITVVVLSVFMGLGQVKDGNIVQNMQQAQSAAVDRWGEYQATKTKLHIDETALAQLNILAGASAQAVAERARLADQIAKYRQEIPKLRTQAQGFQDQYDALNVHDDQFDASDALISTAIAISAVAALVDSMPALYAAWAFAAGGVFMGLAGFLGWAVRSPLAQLLS